MSQTKTPAIKFQAFAVINTTTGEKSRVHYSIDNRIDGRECVTLYAGDYGHGLGVIFADTPAGYTNDTDTQTDYFDKGRVVLFPEHGDLYVAARKAAEKDEARREARIVARAAKIVAARRAAHLSAGV